jgi:hypothetical protein
VREIKFAYGSRSVGDYLVMKIHTDDGAYGIGAGGALWPLVSGENIRGAIQLMEEYFIPLALLGQDKTPWSHSKKSPIGSLIGEKSLAN